MGNGLSVTKNGKLFYMEVQFVYRIIYRLSLKALTYPNKQKNKLPIYGLNLGFKLDKKMVKLLTFRKHIFQSRFYISFVMYLYLVAVTSHHKLPSHIVKIIL